MGQTNGSSLDDEENIQRIFKIDIRNKEQNLTFLTHLTTNKPFLLRKTTFKEEAQMIAVMSELKNRTQIKNPHLTNLVKLQQNKHEDLCSKHYQLMTLWEYPRKTLAEDINQRALARRPYTPQQLIKMIRNIADGCLSLQRYRITHQAITSKTIIVEGENDYRIVDPLALPIHSNLETIYHKRNIKNIYLSPEQCRIIDNQDIRNPVFDPYREDVFTTGVIILEAGLLQRQDHCYEDDCSRINNNRITNNLNRFQGIYGPQIRSYLDRMLIPETSSRIDWLQLIKIVGEENPRRKQFIHRVSNSIKEQKPLKSNYMFSYTNPALQNSKQYVPLQNPITKLLEHPPQYSLIVHEPVKQLNFTNIRTSKASPVRFLNEGTPSPGQFKHEEPIYSIDQFKNGGKYEGYKVNGKRQGFGKYTYQQGGRYEGQWKNDLMCGMGKLYYKSGKIAYDGCLKDDLFHGTGTLYNQNPELITSAFNFRNFQDIDEFWVSYEGNFWLDKKEGSGILLLTNGQILQGSFHEDKVEGEGVFINIKGERIRGVWHDNKFQRQLD